jgi:hypothetical protein
MMQALFHSGVLMLDEQNKRFPAIGKTVQREFLPDAFHRRNEVHDQKYHRHDHSCGDESHDCPPPYCHLLSIHRGVRQARG